MSRTIPASPDCAGQCSSRIEIVPSARAAAVFAGWLVVICAAIGFGVALPWPTRLFICISAATFGFAGIRTGFLLTGRHSVSALAWNEGGELFAYFGPQRVAKAVSLGSGSFHLGGVALFLWLKACDGVHGVFIDTGKQEVRAIRRLIRWLNWRRLDRAPGGAPDCAHRQAVTIHSQGMKCVTRHQKSVN